MADVRNDLGRSTVFSQSIAPADHTATVTGEEVDARKCPRRAVVRVSVGIATIADASKFFTFKVTQCATSGGTFTDADAGQYDFVAPTGSTTAWDGILNATTEGSADYSFNFDMKRTYDYLKVVATETGAAQILFGADIEFIPSEQPATGA